MKDKLQTQIINGDTSTQPVSVSGLYIRDAREINELTKYSIREPIGVLNITF